MIPTENAWVLYYQTFSNGDEVVVITDRDEAFWGRSHATETGILLSRPFHPDKFIEWDDITFMSHDGFPVRKLMGADGSQSIEMTNTETIERDIRRVLTEGHDIKEWVEGDTPHLRSGVFGDPFLVENVSATLMNTFYPGNRKWEPEVEELIYLKAPDGAVGLLYELNRIYHFDALLVGGTHQKPHGNSSAVECLLAMQKVEGSNPFSRSRRIR